MIYKPGRYFTGLGTSFISFETTYKKISFN